MYSLNQWLGLVLVFVSQFGWGQETTPDPRTFFQTGLKLFEQQKFIDALEAFQSAHSTDPRSPAVLFNWGLAAYQVEKKGLALGLWRKALRIDPEHGPSRNALAYAETQLPRELFDAGGDALVALQNRLVRSLSLDRVLFLHLILLSICGWFWIRFFGQRKRALEDEKPLPAVSSLNVFFSVLLVFASTLLALRWSVGLEQHGTVISSGVNLLSFPSPSGTSLGGVLEGLEVRVDDDDGDWLLVQAPSGLTGWMNRKDIFLDKDTPK
jgi:hypothetical protein